MDIEQLGEQFANAETDADNNHWLACYIAWEAWATGRDEWAWMLHKFSGKSTDQVRNRRNAWAMYLELIAETKYADWIRDCETIYFSHFQTCYKYLWHRNELGAKVKTDMTSLIELFIIAKEEALSVVGFSVELEKYFGEDPKGKFERQLDLWFKKGRKLYGLSEYNGVSQKIRRAMKLLIGRIES